MMIVLASLGPVAPATSTPARAAAAKPAGGIACRGAGSPTVVLITTVGESALSELAVGAPGQGSPAALDLAGAAPGRAVLDGIAQFTRVCWLTGGDLLPAAIAPATGPSPASLPPGAAPAAASPIPADLASLPAASPAASLVRALTDAGEPGPFVLVGDAAGSRSAVQLAATRPDLVAGLALINPRSSELLATLDAALPLPPLPLAVIISEHPPGTDSVLGQGSARSPAARTAAWHDAAAALATQSPRGRVVVAPADPAGEAAADIAPGLVTNTIARIVLALREPGAYTPPPTAP